MWLSPKASLTQRKMLTAEKRKRFTDMPRHIVLLRARALEFGLRCKS